jgi:hypothetical protein
MAVDVFAESLARLGGRFAASLDGKIAQICAAMPRLSGSAGAPDAVAEVYRVVHGICGIGALVGFPETARAAKTLEDLLHPAYQTGRPLSADERRLLQNRFQALRMIADEELRLLRTDRR